MSNSPFDNIENAKATEGGNWVRPGRYQVELGTVKMTKSRKKEEFLTIESTVTEVIDNADGVGHRKGEEIVHMLKVSLDSFLGNAKQFVAASLGCHPDDVGSAEADTVVSERQPLEGRVVEFVAENITTAAGHPFTKVIYKGYIKDGTLVAPPLEQSA